MTAVCHVPLTVRSGCLTLSPVVLCRNEAWRFSGGFARAVTLSDVLLKGFKWGFAAFAVALAVEYTMFPPKKGGH